MNESILPDQMLGILKSPMPDTDFEKEHGVAAMIWRRYLRKEIIEREWQLQIAQHTENTANDHKPIPYEEISNDLKTYVSQRIKGLIQRDSVLAAINGQWINSNFRARTKNNTERSHLVWARKWIKKDNYLNGKIENINKVLDEYEWHPFPEEDTRHAKIVQQKDREDRERSK